MPMVDHGDKSGDAEYRIVDSTYLAQRASQASRATEFLDCPQQATRNLASDLDVCK